MDRFPHHIRGPLGPQIHAVPDNEKAYDASGRKLPWGYETLPNVTANLDTADRKEPIERGPFGRAASVRRSRSGGSRSRSKTAEPRAEDVALRERLAGEEAVFGSLRKAPKAEEGVAGVVKAQDVQQTDGEATEVVLWGFGEELQWAALDWYERVSGGAVLEDYDRTPPYQRGYENASYSRATAPRSLSKAALRKKNKYAGGEHWIKITFDSRQAAELAVSRSPHIIKGYVVSADYWQGRGPAKDVPEPATNGQSGGRGGTPFGLDASGSPSGSQTMTSATAASSATVNGRAVSQPPQPQSLQRREQQTTQAQLDQQLSATSTSSQNTFSQSQLTQRHPSNRLIPNARRASLRPAEQALMPKQPKQSWSVWFGASEVIGTTVPKKEDGSFDYERASLYWRFWWWVDGTLGTDFCGIRGDE